MADQYYNMEGHHQNMTDETRELHYGLREMKDDYGIIRFVYEEMGS
jgi:hypothetical protein